MRWFPAAMVLALAGCATPPAPEAPAGSECWNFGHKPLSEILASDWVAYGRITASWEEHVNDALVTGDANGHASLHVRQVLRGRPPKPWTIFPWFLSWTDTAPFQVGEQPQAGDVWVVWRDRSGRDGMPAACV